MNQPDLIQYGIQDEDSDIRAHVCVLAKIVYVFPTWAGVKAINSGKFPSVGASQPGVDFDTSRGILVPPGQIEGCIRISASISIEKVAFSRTDNTTTKGQKAAQVIELLLRKGYFPLPADPGIAKSLDLQRRGIDILVSGNWRIQVKCDYEGGIGAACTGNLFIQTDEINPLRCY
jgi:hypothetical protein